LDWEAGKACLDSLTEDDFDGTGLVKKDYLPKLESLKAAVKDRHREAVVLQYGHLKVLLTGGMSWGDSPSDLYNDMNDLIELAQGRVLEAIGFDLDDHDYKSILMKILGVMKESKQLPCLIHLDSQLDPILETMLRSGPEFRKPKRS
jgi:hypothetical protein